MGTWQGAFEDDVTQWLRFYDAEGNLILLPEEAAQQRAEAAQSKAEQLATCLRELGENPDSLRSAIVTHRQ